MPLDCLFFGAIASGQRDRYTKDIRDAGSMAGSRKYLEIGSACSFVSLEIMDYADVDIEVKWGRCFFYA